VKIDAFCPIMPRPYYDRFFQLETTPHAANLRKRVSNIPCSDSPYDSERGPGYIRATIKNLEEIGLSAEEQEAIFSGNVIRLTGLTVKG
jgi:hypothetical protein